MYSQDNPMKKYDFMYNLNNLFSKYDLGEYLRNSNSKILNDINNINAEKIVNTKDDIFINELIQKYTLQAPTLLDDKIEISAEEADVTTRSHDPLFDDGNCSFTKKGLMIFVNIPFAGSDYLFDFRPSTYSLSGMPSAKIEKGKLILMYETIEKDPEKIKGLWLKDIKTIKDYLIWIDNDLKNFNNSLENFIKPLIKKRKQEANINKSLIDSLKINI